VKNSRAKVTSGDTEINTTLSECELYMSEKSISLVFKQAPCELCSLYRTKVMMIFGGGKRPKKNNFFSYDFYTRAPHKLHDIGC
jgi:hypothetical protein